MKRLSAAFGLAVAFLATAGGCSYRGADMNDPLTRRLNWYSFVAGEDIKAQCVAGAPAHMRVVYNGFWHDQVRIYEFGTPAAPLALKARVLTGASISYFSTGDWMSPWQGVTSEVALQPTQRDQIMDSLDASGLKAPPPVGLRLPSDGFYWTAVGCRDGRFQFNAWLYPSDGFKQLTFPMALMAFDRTGVPLQEADPQHVLTFYSQQQLDRERWIIQVHEEGLSTSGSF